MEESAEVVAPIVEEVKEVVIEEEARDKKAKKNKKAKKVKKDKDSEIVAGDD